MNLIIYICVPHDHIVCDYFPGDISEHISTPFTYISSYCYDQIIGITFSEFTYSLGGNNQTSLITLKRNSIWCTKLYSDTQE